MSIERLQLDYVALPTRVRWLGVLLLAVSLAVASDVVLRFRDARAALQQFEAARSALAEPRRPVKTVPRERLEEHRKAAQATIRQLALPWNRLVRTLEIAALEDVAILQIQPDAQQRLIRLAGEAPDLSRALHYLGQLSMAPGLSDVHLVGHQVREDDPRRPLQFTLQASFRQLP